MAVHDTGMRAWILAVGIGICAGGGCGRGDDRMASPKDDAPTPSPTLVDHLTGRTAVNQGRAASDEIRRISAERNRQLDAVLGE